MAFVKLSIFFTLLGQVFAGDLIAARYPISRELKQFLGYPQETYLNFTELVTVQGYLAEEHTVTTEDGYILTLFRMQSPNCTVLRSPPVLLMHGLWLNSESFLDAGPDAGLPYLMADSCYDVWVGNKRGTNYGRRHTTLNPDNDAEFWKFSIDEVGYYDFPAFIDYVIENTSSEKINFVGFSQGGLGIIITCTDRPEYNDKLNVSIALAPATRLKNSRSMPLRLLSETYALLEGVLEYYALEEMSYKDSLIQVLLEFICKSELLADTCLQYFGYIDYYNSGSVSNHTANSFFSHLLMGTSTRMLAKVGQNFFKGEMLKYDYGTQGNLEKYGSETAPEYNLINMVSPLVLLTGKQDHFSDITDVNWLGSQMQNVLEVYNVTDPNWDHFDMTNSKNIPIYVYPKIEEYLSNYSTSGSPN